MTQNNLASRAVIFLAILLLPVCVAGQQRLLSEAEVAEEYRQSGLASYRAGKYKDAVEAYSRALRLKQDSPTLYHNLGMAYVQLGRYREAIQAFEQTTRLNPNDGAAHSVLGAMSLYFGQYEQAGVALKRAISLNGGDVEALNNLGVTYYREGKLQQAADSLKQAISVAADKDVLHLNLSNVYRKLGQDDAAYEHVKLANRFGPRHANRLGTILIPAGVRPIELQARAGEEAVNAPTSAPPPGTPQRASQGPHDAPSVARDAPSEVKSVESGLAPRESRPSPEAAKSGTAAVSDDLVRVYRVGVGDVLDIRLLNTASRDSTLYTVLEGGLIEYPLAPEPLAVAGKTTDEIKTAVAAELQRRGVEKDPQLLVNVREYASHSVIVSGLVNNPGTKFLRREAVPLYVLFADAQPQPEARRVIVISTAQRQATEIDIADLPTSDVMVRPGDVINVLADVPRFYYIGGAVSQPGQKVFHSGVTLTQAILAAGGVLQSNKTAYVIRQGDEGRLVTQAHKLKHIVAGVAPDPLLRPSDRVEIAP